MSGRRQLDERLTSLDEIRDVMSSLKTLALLETHKLARYADAQQKAVATLRTAAADFTAHFPVGDWQPRCTFHAVIALGSEHGFCGAYNDLLATAVRDTAAIRDRHAVIAVGRKLAAKLEPAADLAIEGAIVSEEAQRVLLRVADALVKLQQREGGVALSVLYLDPNTRAVQTRPLFPLVPAASPGAAKTTRPNLNVAPRAMFEALLEEQLYTLLVAAYYEALSAENRMRMEHLEGAVEHLDRQRGELRLKRNYLRQEEITEEIEVILLSAAASTDAGR